MIDGKAFVAPNGSELIARAKQALQNAHVPYSNFPVGAAVVSASGEVTIGTNIENASYGLTMCAERVALFTAITAGVKDIKAIAVVAKRLKPVLPCGACRQVMSELMAPDAVVYLENENNTVSKMLVSELLPAAFTKENLSGGTPDSKLMS